MLLGGNISFVIRMTKLVTWQVANDNTCIISQKMNPYFFNFFYTSTIHVVYNCLM